MTTRKLLVRSHAKRRNGTPSTGRPSIATFADSNAYRAGDEGRQVGQGASLQRLLTHSYSGKVLAVRRVTENTGKKTPVWTEKSGTTREEDTGSA